MRPFLFSILLLASLASAEAQMFATIQECDKRYGKPVPPTGATSDVRFYKEGELLVKILFVEEKAAVITFTAAAKKIEPARCTSLLENNAAGNRWEEIEGEGSKTWRRSDGLAFGIYDPSSGEMTLISTDYLEKSRSETQTVSNGKKS